MSEKNGEDGAKDPPILDTLDVEDNTSSAIHEEGCESLRKIIPKKVMKYAKPMKTWKTRSTKNVFSSCNAILLRQRDFVDIFDSTTTRWLSY